MIGVNKSGMTKDYCDSDFNNLASENLYQINTEFNGHWAYCVESSSDGIVDQ